MKPYLAIELRPCAIQLFVPLGAGFRIGDAAQVQPGANHLVEAAAGCFEGGAHLEKNIPRLFGGTREVRIGLYPCAISPLCPRLLDAHGVRASILHPYIRSSDR